jgi:hypothetical protein
MSGMICNPEKDTGHPVQILAGWSEVDPMVVSMLFLPEGHPDHTEWVFARDLLLEAMENPDEWVGEGDVTLRSYHKPGELEIQLMSPEGACRVLAPSFMVAHMVAQSCEIIEPGSAAEDAVYSAQFDAEIEELTL